MQFSGKKWTNNRLASAALGLVLSVREILDTPLAENIFHVQAIAPNFNFKLLANLVPLMLFRTLSDYIWFC